MYQTLFAESIPSACEKRVTPIIALLLLNREWEVNNGELSQ